MISDSMLSFYYFRNMKVLKGYVRNPNRPEGCIAQCYIAEEAVEFCSEFLVDLENVGVPSIRNMTKNVGDNGIYDGKTIGAVLSLK